MRSACQKDVARFLPGCGCPRQDERQRCSPCDDAHQPGGAVCLHHPPSGRPFAAHAHDDAPLPGAELVQRYLSNCCIDLGLHTRILLFFIFLCDSRFFSRRCAARLIVHFFSFFIYGCTEISLDFTTETQRAQRI